MKTRITKLAPGINPDIVSKGLLARYRRNVNADAIRGYVTTHDDRNVSIKGLIVGKGIEQTEIINADVLRNKNYLSLHYWSSEDTITSEDTDNWTVDDAVTIFDPEICVKKYFIRYKKKTDLTYTNAVINNCDEKTLTVHNGVSGLRITIEEALQPEFDVIISEEITTTNYDGSEIYGTFEYIK